MSADFHTMRVLKASGEEILLEVTEVDNRLGLLSELVQDEDGDALGSMEGAAQLALLLFGELAHRGQLHMDELTEPLDMIQHAEIEQHTLLEGGLYQVIFSITTLPALTALFAAGDTWGDADSPDEFMELFEQE